MSTLPLESKAWSELNHAYGPAADIPDRLRAIADFPVDEWDAEPWSHLWSALCHQGDIYPASFAAVPHIVAALLSDPRRATPSFFALPAAIESARLERAISIPSDLQPAYKAGFEKLAHLASHLAMAPEPSVDRTLLLSIVCLAAGDGETGRLMFELEPERINQIRRLIDDGEL